MLSSHDLSSNSQLFRRQSDFVASLAALSSALPPLMREYDIKAEFRAVHDGLVIVDATRNETSAYKLRGALASTYAAKQEGGTSVWTASAGNHGAGVAMAAKLLGLDATVYVPVTAPEVKVRNIKSFGARVVTIGYTFDECLANAYEEQALGTSKSTFIHPFDNLVVAAGQGTLGLELFDHLTSRLKHQHPAAVRVFVPIGGGGLISGMAATLRSVWNDSLPPLQIIGVVDESSPASVVGTLFGRPVAALPDTVADGTRVARVGQTFLDASSLIDFIMPVPHDELVATMSRHYDQTKEALEPSGALALTGEALVRQHKLLPQTSSSSHYAVVSGRNIDADTFTSLVSAPARCCQRSHCRIAYQVRIPEQNGELLHFLNTVPDFNIAGLTYKQRSGDPLGDLRVEFEVMNSQAMNLHERLIGRYKNSVMLSSARSLLLPVGEPVAKHYRDELVTLEDRAGSFRDYIQGLHDGGTLGSVGFLFYRQPAQPGSKAQVVIGRAPASPSGEVGG
ncbi:MAG: threonine ammonia-lyase, biosynthetic [Pseudomonadota bacterium]